MPDKEQNWYFTFGYGQRYQNGYAKVHGTYGSARTEMVRRHGSKWAFQYESAEAAGVEEFNLREIK